MTKTDSIYSLNDRIVICVVRRFNILWKCNLFYGFNSRQNVFSLNLS